MYKTLLSVLLSVCLLVSALVPCAAVSASEGPMLGDLTEDGTLNTLDALMLFSHVSGKRTLNSAQRLTADYNRDGEVNGTDALQLFAFACGKRLAHPAPADPTSDAFEVFQLVNKEREAAGLEPLEYCTDLQQLADIRAAEIIESFSHTRPDGRRCFSVFEDFDCFRYWPAAGGENIAIGQATPERVMECWMQSDGHRANILSSSWEYVFVGVLPVPEGYRYHNGGTGKAWVQLFLS